MTKIFIDTNVLIYFFDKLEALHQNTIVLLKRIVANKQEGIITPFVANEFHYHYIKYYEPKTAEKLTNRLNEIPCLSWKDLPISRTEMATITQISTKYSLKTMDAFHAFSCRKLGIKKIATFDKDFDRVPWLQVLK